MVEFLPSIPTARLSRITSVTLYGDIHNLERKGREHWEHILSSLRLCTGLEKVRILVYDYLADLIDYHSDWLGRELATGRKFKHGVWIERVTSFVQRDPPDWETPSWSPVGSDDGVESQSNEETSQRNEKMEVRLSLRYQMREKYRFDEDGNRADHWDWDWSGRD